MPVDFVETSDQEMFDILEININSTLKITKCVLPGMISRYIPILLHLPRHLDMFTVSVA